MVLYSRTSADVPLTVDQAVRQRHADRGSNFKLDAKMVHSQYDACRQCLSLPPEQFARHIKEHRIDVTAVLERHWRVFFVLEVLDNMFAGQYFSVSYAHRHLRLFLHLILRKLYLPGIPRKGLSSAAPWVTGFSLVRPFEPSTLRYLLRPLFAPFCYLPHRLMFELDAGAPLLSEAKQATEAVLGLCLQSLEEVQARHPAYAGFLSEGLELPLLGCGGHPHGRQCLPGGRQRGRLRRSSRTRRTRRCWRS